MDAARLKPLAPFAALSNREREEVARHADEVDVPAGKRLVGEGEFGYEFFAIQEGTASVVREGEPLRSLGPGDFFGEIALLETERRTATVIAETPMRVIVMTRADFRAITRASPALAERIESAIRERIAR